MSVVINRFNGTSGYEVTPDDNNDVSGGGGAALYVGTGGDVTVELAGQSGKTLTFRNVADGTFMPIQVKKVLTATTATDILALY